VSYLVYCDREVALQTLRVSMLILSASLLSQPALCATLPSPEQLCEKSFQNEDYNQAFRYCSEAAQQGQMRAQWRLANCYEHGFGTERDLFEAKFWYEKAALQNHVTSQLHLGKLYSKGLQNDHIKAFQFFSLAAAQNEPQAQFLVSLCYQNGVGVLPNPQQAIYWYQLAAKNGLMGAKILSDQELRNAAALEIKSGVQAFNKAQQLKSKKSQDTHPENDYFSWLTLSAEEGHPLAQFELAESYLNGRYLSVNEDFAIEWLKKAAQANYAKAQSYLAWIYAIDPQSEANLSKANQLFLEARYNIHRETNQASDHPSTAPVLHTKSDLQIYGSYHKRFNESKKMIESAKDKQQQTQSIQLLTEMANQNYIPAQLYLAQLYQLGDKIEKSKLKAADLYEKAAKLGSPEAQYALGWLYYYGEGVPPNHEVAIKWLQAASKSGLTQSADAIQFIKTLNSTSQPKHIAKK